VLSFVVLGVKWALQMFCRGWGGNLIKCMFILVVKQYTALLTVPDLCSVCWVCLATYVSPREWTGSLERSSISILCNVVRFYIFGMVILTVKYSYSISN
jgi:hypothetical protein